MKTSIITLFFSLCIAGFTMAQDDTRLLSDYSELSVSGGINVELYHGSPKAEIEMVTGDIDKLVTEVKGNTLKIYFDNKKWGMRNGKNKANIELYFEKLTDVSVSAGANVESGEIIKAKNFDADVSSGATLDINVEAATVDSDVSSGATIAMSGKTDNLDVDVSSGASFRGLGLEAKNVDCDVSSGGSIKVWVTESLEADASSGGSVKYKGEPKKTNIDAGKWSGGSISKM